MFKTSFKQVFDNLNVNLRKHEEFLTSIPCIPILEYGQSNAPIVTDQLIHVCIDRPQHHQLLGLVSFNSVPAA